MPKHHTRSSTPAACARCGATFYPRLDALKAGYGRFCSRFCGQHGHGPSRVPRPSAAERFWAKVQKTDTCWLWTGGRHEFGYGSFSVRPGYRDVSHRVAWILTHGPIPDGLYVLHSCPGGDNPRCVNPAHLRLGTQGENMRDRMEHGVTQSPLTADQVRAMRAQRANGATVAELAEQYPMVGRWTIRAILRRASWRHI